MFEYFLSDSGIKDFVTINISSRLNGCFWKFFKEWLPAASFVFVIYIFINVETFRKRTPILQALHINIVSMLSVL
jgi:hypothetical protein